MIKGEFDSEAVDHMRPYIGDYVCLLDDPVMRRIALEMDFTEADKIIFNEVPCHSSDKYAIKQVARVMCETYSAVSGCSGNYTKAVTNSSDIRDALHTLALNISTREDRIIACRQLYLYPYHLCCTEQDDETLDENALHVASCVKDALDLLGLAIPRLRKEVKE